MSQLRINSALNVIKINNLKLLVDHTIFNDTEFFATPENIMKLNIYNKQIEEIEETNYDSDIMELYKSLDMKDIMNSDKNINQFLNIPFYGKKLISDFISSRVIRNIINTLFIKTTYKYNKRTVKIFSSNVLNDVLIKKIDSIFNFFDILTGTENKYYLEIFLSSKKKFFNKNLDSIDSDNINSGATLPGEYIYLWRCEELTKVLIHELVHYLHLDMARYQNKFKVLYKDINLEAGMINPNEAYTEFLALFLMSIWSFYYNSFDGELNEFVNKRLTIELGWSYHQIAKILKYFKCYSNYDDLFTNNCTFKQNTNVLSYFILKTYFLQNINIILSKFNLQNLYVTDEISKYILNNTDLRDDKFTENINNIIKLDLNENKYDLYSSRMTCLD